MFHGLFPVAETGIAALNQSLHRSLARDIHCRRGIKCCMARWILESEYIVGVLDTRREMRGKRAVHNHHQWSVIGMFADYMSSGSKVISIARHSQ